MGTECQFYSIDETSRLLGKSATTIRRWVRKGFTHCQPAGPGSSILIPKGAIEALSAAPAEDAQQPHDEKLPPQPNPVGKVRRGHLPGWMRSLPQESMHAQS